MGSLGMEQSGFASARAREAASQKSTRPGWKGDEGTSSADVLLPAGVKGRYSQLRWLLKERHIRLKRRTGSTIVLLLRMLIMLLGD